MHTFSLCCVLLWCLWCSHEELTWIPAWINIHMPSKVWDEITYPFPNFNGATVEVWEWISNYIPHFMMMSLLIHAAIKVSKGSHRNYDMAHTQHKKLFMLHGIYCMTTVMYPNNWTSYWNYNTNREMCAYFLGCNMRFGTTKPSTGYKNLYNLSHSGTPFL